MTTESGCSAANKCVHDRKCPGYRECSEFEMPEITDVRRITLQPGDHLVIRTPEPLDMATADRLHQVAQRWAGREIPVLILPDGWQIDVVQPAAEQP